MNESTNPFLLEPPSFYEIDEGEDGDEQREENPRRRGRRRGRGRRRKARRKSRSRRRKNPFAFASSGGRRRRKGRRKHARRRGHSRRRSNPFSMGGLTRGDGIMATAVAGSINQAANIAGELASSGLYKLRDKMKLNFFPSDSSTQLGVAIVGGFLLKRFGGPLRAFWRPWVKGNVQGALNKAGWLPNGYTVARKVGLGDYLTAQNMQLGGRQVTYGQLAAPPVMLYGQDYNGLPSYAQ